MAIQKSRRRSEVSRSKRSTKPRRSKTRPIHRRILSHPISLFSLLVFGVLMSGFTFYQPMRNWADSFAVSATVPAPPLTEPAVITYPSDGTIVSSSPLSVSGTCPQNSYVDLIRNGSFSGSAVCDNNGDFQIVTDLTVGTNTLQAQDYNITNQAGPTSAAITIYYQPAVSPNPPATVANSPSSSTPPPNEKNASPLLLTTKYQYSTAYVGQEYSWQFHISGGISPYRILISWGDSSSSSLLFKSNTDFNIAHTYTSAGTNNITVTATDNKGAKALLQISVLVKPAPVVSGSSNHNKLSIAAPTNRAIPGWLLAIWPFYIITLLMAVSYWLGEREEYKHLARKGLLRKAH